MHAIVGVAALAALFAVFVGFRLADRRGCGTCSGSGAADCTSCPLGDHKHDSQGRTR